MSNPAADIEIRRIYDVGSETPAGATFLVDGMWPRGVRKEDLGHAEWLRGIAPSAELRRWFGHEPARFAEFRERFRRELAANHAALEPLLDAARKGPVTLLYAAKDEEHNNAVVLREYLIEVIGQQH